MLIKCDSCLCNSVQSILNWLVVFVNRVFNSRLDLNLEKLLVLTISVVNSWFWFRLLFRSWLRCFSRCWVWNVWRMHYEALVHIVNACVESVNRVEALPLIKKLVQNFACSYNKWIFDSLLERVTQKHLWSDPWKSCDKYKVDRNLILPLCVFVLNNQRSLQMGKFGWRCGRAICKMLCFNCESLILVEKISNLNPYIFFKTSVLTFW